MVERLGCRALGRLGQRLDWLGHVGGDARDVVAAQLDLACVHAGADLEAEVSHRRGEMQGTVHRGGRTVEGGEVDHVRRLDELASVRLISCAASWLAPSNSIAVSSLEVLSISVISKTASGPWRAGFEEPTPRTSTCCG